MYQPPPTVSGPPNITPRVIIHGGAGAITRKNLPPPRYTAYRRSLLAILASTQRQLVCSAGGESDDPDAATTTAAAPATALDAATHAVALLEDDPLFNAAHGAVFARDGSIELEASIMVSHGWRKRGVAVSLVRKGVRNPIRLAREVLVRGGRDGGGDEGEKGSFEAAGAGEVGAQGHCHLSGETAERLAAEWGLEGCDAGYYWTKRRWEEHKRGLEREGEAVKSWAEVAGVDMGEEGGSDLEDATGDTLGGDPSYDPHSYLPQGTVGCVVLDRYGTICVATSTGGLTNKLPGRIGDTPTLGAGFWAEEWNTTSDLIVDSSNFRSYTMQSLLPSLSATIWSCFPNYSSERTFDKRLQNEDGKPSSSKRAVAVSGTGNGDSFLRTAACRTACAIPHFAPSNSFQSAVTQIAGPGGELQRSAGDRWGKTGEGEGGIIGIEMVDGQGIVVADFNCGGMYRAWIDDQGKAHMMVFREEYKA